MIIEMGHGSFRPGLKELFFTIMSDTCMVPSFCFDSDKDIAQNQWHHFAVVVGDSFNTGYFDGRPMVDCKYNFGDASSSEFFEDVTQREVIYIGKGFWKGEPVYFDGLIDDVRIYDRPLAPSEVYQLYRMGTPASSIPLWKAY
jgi:hypothetical protein